MQRIGQLCRPREKWRMPAIQLQSIDPSGHSTNGVGALMIR
jgi:hypothetical protein